jgi:uncharacterized protein
MLWQRCLTKQLTGNDLPDAWLSAAVSYSGEHRVSLDRNVRRLHIWRLWMTSWAEMRNA